MIEELEQIILERVQELPQTKGAKKSRPNGFAFSLRDRLFFFLCLITKGDDYVKFCDLSDQDIHSHVARDFAYFIEVFSTCEEFDKYFPMWPAATDADKPVRMSSEFSDSFPACTVSGCLLNFEFSDNFPACTQQSHIDTMLESRQELGSMDKDLPGNIGACDGHPHEDGKVRESSLHCRALF